MVLGFIQAGTKSTVHSLFDNSKEIGTKRLFKKLKDSSRLRNTKTGQELGSQQPLNPG